MNNEKPYGHHVVNDSGVNVKNQLSKEYKDKNGDVLKDKLDGNGKVVLRERLVYNKEGKIISTVITRFGRDDQGRITQRHDDTHNAAGKLVKSNDLVRTGRGESVVTKTTESKFNGEYLVLTVATTLDFRKNISNKVSQAFDQLGNVIFSKKSIYGDNNKLIESIESKNIFDNNKLTHNTQKNSDGAGVLIFRSERNYSNQQEQNHSIYFEERRYGSDNKLIEIADVTQDLDNNGKVVQHTEDIFISEEELMNENHIKTVEKRFDVVGNVIYFETSNKSGSEKNIIHQEFNSFGKLKSKIEETQRIKNGRMYGNEKYIYDANEVLIRIIEEKQIHDESSRVLVSRDEITYEIDLKNETTGSVKLLEQFNSAGELISRVTTNHDADGVEIIAEPIEASQETVQDILVAQPTPVINNNDAIPKVAELETRRIVDRTYKNGCIVLHVKTIDVLSGILLSQEEDTYDSNENITSKVTEQYDNNKNLIQRDILSQQFNSAGNLDRKVELEQKVDSKGRLTHSTEKTFDGNQNFISHVKIEQVYDIYGNRTLQAQRTYDAQEKSVSYVMSEQNFDSDNKRTGVVKVHQIFSPGGKIASSVTDNYDFDAHGVFARKTKLSQKFNSDGVLSYCSRMTSDAKGRELENMSGLHNHKSMASDQLTSAMNGFGLEFCIRDPAPVDNIFAPYIMQPSMMTTTV